MFPVFRIISFKNFINYLILLGVFIYTAIRGYLLSFTHDESISLAISQGDTEWMFTSNNHLLNTVLMLIFGSLSKDELILRLPNILSFGIFILILFKIIKKSNWSIVISIFGFIIFNPIIIEFFGLARGYGLAMTFMMLSIYYLLKNKPNLSINDIKKVILFASLSFLSNLIMFNFFIAISIVILTINYNESRKLDLNHLQLKKIISFMIFPFIIGSFLLLYLNSGNQLYHGEQSLLNSIDSLILDSFYFQKYSSLIFSVVKYFVVISFFSGIIFIGFTKKFTTNLFKVTILILLLIIGLFLENILFSAPYPSGRTGIYFIPLFGLFIYYFITEIQKKYNLKDTPIIIVCSFLSLPLIFNFLININLKYSKTWIYDAYSKDAILEIENSIENPNQIFTISNDWFFEPALNYYITSKNINLELTDREGINYKSDFIYTIDGKEAPKNYSCIKKYNFNDVYLENRFELLLWKKNN